MPSTSPRRWSSGRRRRSSVSARSRLCDANAAIQNSQPDAYLNLLFGNEDQGCGTASGNFGTLGHPLPGRQRLARKPGRRLGALRLRRVPPDDGAADRERQPGIPASNLADDFEAILGTSHRAPDVRRPQRERLQLRLQHHRVRRGEGLRVKLTSGSGSLATGSCFQSSSGALGEQRPLRPAAVRAVHPHRPARPHVPDRGCLRPRHQGLEARAVASRGGAEVP